MLFKGVEIEKCPDCGAVLLDPGELEQLAGKDESGFFADLFGS
jgi:Zn-finger nucleic acid-binding protein